MPMVSLDLNCLVNQVDLPPLGFVTWAWIDDYTKEELHQTGRALRDGEWNNGANLFFNDWVTDERAFRTIFKYIKNELFVGEKSASSVRRMGRGGIRKINSWTKPIAEFD